MERSEPALVPEWLRSTGSVTGGGTSTHQLASSLQSDVSSSFPSRNRCSRSNSEKDSQRPAFLDRSFSSNSRRSSGSNGSAKHPYSSFTRSHRDRNREKDKERFITGDLWDRDSSGSLENILTSSIDKTSLRRSQSLAPRRTGEVLPRRTEDLRNGANGNHYNGNGLILGGSHLSGIQKAAFEKDFPSLGTEEKPGRVSSPVLSTAVQSLPIGNSGLLGGEKWTSALAEVPAIISGNTIINASTPQIASSTPSSSASNLMTGLNMAEALSQAPAQYRTAPQVPDKTQRLDELTMKQCRQLIPRAPSMPKALVPNISEKLKQPKAGARVNESIVAARSIQPQSPQLSNQPRGAQVRPDAPNTPHAGKFLVLKPSRENGMISTAKDVSTPTNSANGKVGNGQQAGTPLTPTSLTNPSNPKAPVLEKKAAALTLNHKPVVEKKSTLSQAQSRSDFFNLMRKKTSVNASSNASDSSPDISSCIEKSDENRKEAESAPVSTGITEKFNQMLTNGDIHDPHDKGQGFPDIGEKDMSNGRVFPDDEPDEEPDEEEAAFLRSLGWKENGEAEVITQEEINAFYEEYMNLRPSLKLWRGIQPKLAMLSGSQSSNSVAAASESSSGGSESEA